MTSEAALVLPKHGPYDHTIELKKGAVPPWGPIYALNEAELEELRKWLKRMRSEEHTSELQSRP